jgi:glycosyltransferase involved in cell wall biosynthesis
LSIVIPAYNEAASLDETLRTVTAYLDGHASASELIVVDDGSTDATTAILARYAAARPALRILRNEPNAGKGASVRRGVLEAKGKYIFFMDADLSVPIDELAGALAALKSSGHPVLIGSRRIRGARIERHQPRLRECLGYAFTGLTRLLLCPAIVDFTCGFKGFRRDAATLLFGLQQCNDWAFDAEILYLARLTGTRVLQYPVRWSHQKNSRVRFPRDIYRTLAALVRIRSRAGHAVEHRQRRSAVLGQGRAARMSGLRD